MINLDPGEIFDSFYDKVYSFTLLRVGNIHDAEDIASDVFVKIVAKLGTYDPEKAALSTWIFTIALNEIRTYFRRRKVVISIDDIHELIGQFDPEQRLLHREEYMKLYSAIRKLDDRQKNIVLLKYFGGVPNTQIAEMLGLSESNVGFILHRARKFLKNSLVSSDELEFAAHKR
ncbi:MAG: sigma-70 family RNA polymerase sigma factor [Oscillospiraceae bacterium]|nr:sigma-70 family RNA polymerase sigma factor [Oscillospiraceae bacterium]MCL2278889.1 sigma-70 family RNA polymerase sigma factor [Oscillospiraceae bacterium]